MWFVVMYHNPYTERDAVHVIKQTDGEDLWSLIQLAFGLENIKHVWAYNNKHMAEAVAVDFNMNRGYTRTGNIAR